MSKDSSPTFLNGFFALLEKLNGFHIVALSFLVRLGYSLFYWNSMGARPKGDAKDYWQFASEMLTQGWMVPDISRLYTHSGPGLSAIMAIDLSVFNSEVFPLTHALLLIGSCLIPLVIFYFAKALNIPKALSVFLAIWLVFYMHHIRYAPLLLKETMVFALFPLALYSMLEIKKSRKFIWVFVLSYGYLIHTDERYFFYLPFLILYMIWGKNRIEIKRYLYGLIGLFLFMTPWLVRNYIVFDRPVILTERVAKITDKVLGYKTPVNKSRNDRLNSYDRKNLPAYEAFTDSLLAGHEVKSKRYKYIREMEQGIEDGNIPQTFNYVKAKWQELKEMMRPLRLQAGYTANGYRYWSRWKLESNLSYGIQYGIPLLLFIPAVFLVFSSTNTGQRDFWILLLAIYVAHIFLHLFVAHALQRYRVPVDFIMFLFVFRGISLLPLFKKNAVSTNLSQDKIIDKNAV